MSNSNTEKSQQQCEICLSEIPSDAEWCPVCGAEQDQKREEPAEEITWAIVKVVNTAIEAELMAGRLRSLGIPAIVLSQVDTTRNFTVGELAIAKVFVPTKYFTQAEQILAVDADEWNNEEGDNDMGDNDDAVEPD